MNLSNITILTPSGTPEASLRYCAVAPIVVMSDYVKVHIPGSDSIETIVSGAISVEEIPATTTALVNVNTDVHATHHILDTEVYILDLNGQELRHAEHVSDMHLGPDNYVGYTDKDGNPYKISGSAHIARIIETIDLSSELTTEEPTTEEPNTKEPTTEEPTTEEPTTEEPTTEDF